MFDRSIMEWTPAFLKLQKKLIETQKGGWVSVSKKIQDKYSNLILTNLCRFKTDNEYIEYRAETKDKFINIKTFVNYVSMVVADTEYGLDNSIDVVGAINDERNITIDEISYYLNWEKPQEYVELD